MKKMIIGIGIVVAVLGIIFVFLSHDAHNIILHILTGETQEPIHKHHEHGSHDVHQLIGMVILITGMIISMCGWKFVK